MKKIFNFILILLFISNLALGQGNNTSEITTKKKSFWTDSSMFRKTSFDFSAGSRGVGIGLRYRINSRFSLRAGISTMPIEYNTKLTISGYASNIDLVNKFNGVQFFLDFKPIEKFPVRIIGGFSWFYDALISADLVPQGNYSYGTLQLDYKTIGTLHASLDYSGIAPFIGIGVGNQHPKHQIGFSMGLGVYYLPEPKVIVTGTKFLSGNDGNTGVIANNLTNYRYLPVVNLHLIYRLKKSK